MGRVKEDLLPENFAVIRCLVFFVSLSFVRRLFCDIWWLDFCSRLWSRSLPVRSVRFCFLSRAFPLRLSSFLFVSLLRVSLLSGVGRGGGLFPCSASPLSLLRSRCRRCRQELAHDSTPSFPPFSFSPSSPLFPLVAAGLLSFPPSLSLSLSFLSLFFLCLSLCLSLFLSLPFSFAVVLAMLCVAIGY